MDKKSQGSKEKAKQVDEAIEAMQYEKEIQRKKWQMGIHRYGFVTSIS